MTSSWSCEEGLFVRLDELAVKRGLSRSALLVSLVRRELESEGRRGPEVVVDGRRFVPARGGRR